MVNEIIMPKLGATMEEGFIVSWIVNEGDFVEEGDPIAEIQTDKIVLEIEAETSGFLLKKLYGAGVTVNVHEIIAYMGAENNTLENIPVIEKENDSQQENQVLQVLDKPRKTPAANKLAKENNIALSLVPGTGPNNRIQRKDIENYLNQESSSMTPLAKKIAKDLNVNQNELTGTGHNGKITKIDVLSSMQTPTAKEEISNITKIPLKGMRKVIAERMSESYYTAPHVTLNVEINMAECVSLRKQLIPIIEKETSHRLSYNDLIIKAVAHTLTKNKSLNISLQKDEIYQYQEINIGFAVALDEGLVVPVIKNTNKLGLSEIVSNSKQLITNIKSGKLDPKYFEQGTFTISNLGMYAVDTFTPIINQPQAAILGVGRIVEKPVVKDGDILINPMMHLSLSFDHRIIDGAPAAQFLTDLKEYLENPMKMLV